VPTLLIFKGFKFYFYSNENKEPTHIHISKGDASAKWWLLPEIAEEYSYGFNTNERRIIAQVINENSESFIKKWNGYFNR
jgi:hypothetical protein